MLGATPRNRAGSAGGLQSTARVLGQAAGTTMVAMVFHFAEPNGNVPAGAGLAVWALLGAAGLACSAAGVNLVRQRTR